MFFAASATRLAILIVLGTVGGLASIIPVVGSPLVWVPIVIAFFVMGSYWKALIFALWGGVIVGSIDNVLRPTCCGRWWSV